MHIMPEHLLRGVPFEQLAASPLARNPVGSARFRFARWEAGSRLELVADTANWRGRAKLDRVLFTFTSDPNAVFTRVFAGEADLAEPLLNPALLAEVARKPELALKTAPGMSYAVLQFNMRDPRNLSRPHPFLGDARVRRALSMAVDRDRLVKNVFDSLARVAVGPMTRAQALSDTTIAQLPYDVAHARALLDSAGWRLEAGAEVRTRDGRPLRLEVPVPATSATRQRAAVLLQEMFRQVGVQLDIASVEMKVAFGRMESGDWDAFLNAFGADPAPSGLFDTWGPEGELNFGKWTNAEFTAHADSGAHALSAADTRRHLSRAYETIVADAPAIWLYEIRHTAVLHSRFQTTGMRPDEWWAGLADWTVPEARRIDRDRIGLRVAAR
jgi:peptide/nickel transport system substrate-binding protein